MKNNKKTISKISIFLIITILFTIISTISISAADFKLNYTQMTIAIGESQTLKLENTNEKIKWSSENKEVATVDSTGKVIGKISGETIIIATVGDDEYHCQVTVKNYRIYAKSSTMKVNDNQTLTLKGKTSGKTIMWSTSDKSIATVSEKGVVTAKKAGTVKISAKIDKATYTKTLAIENIKPVENKTTETSTAKTKDSSSSLGTRANPYPANNKVNIESQEYASSGIKNIKLTVESVITGSGANELIKSENRFNKGPTSAQEWRIYTFNLKYVSGDENDVLKASDIIYKRNMFNQQGQNMIIHDTATLGDEYGAYDIYTVKLYPGGSSKVVFAVLTDKSEGSPLIQVKNNGGKNSNWVSCKTASTSSVSTKPSESETDLDKAKAEADRYIKLVKDNDENVASITFYEGSKNSGDYYYFDCYVCFYNGVNVDATVTVYKNSYGNFKSQGLKFNQPIEIIKSS